MKYFSGLMELLECDLIEPNWTIALIYEISLFLFNYKKLQLPKKFLSFVLIWFIVIYCTFAPIWRIKTNIDKWQVLSLKLFPLYALFSIVW